MYLKAVYDIILQLIMNIKSFVFNVTLVKKVRWLYLFLDYDIEMYKKAEAKYMDFYLLTKSL